MGKSLRWAVFIAVLVLHSVFAVIDVLVCFIITHDYVAKTWVTLLDFRLVS